MATMAATPTAATAATLPQCKAGGAADSHGYGAARRALGRGDQSRGGNHRFGHPGAARGAGIFARARPRAGRWESRRARPRLAQRREMSAELLLAATTLVLLAYGYVCLRRGRHGGLAGGDSTGVAPDGVAEPGTARTFSAAEVAHHATADDLWLVIAGKVYDFSDVSRARRARAARPRARQLRSLTDACVVVRRRSTFGATPAGRRFCATRAATRPPGFPASSTRRRCGTWCVGGAAPASGAGRADGRAVSDLAGD